MKKILLLIISSFLLAESPYLEDEKTGSETNPSSPPYFLNAIQGNFFKKGRGGKENTLKIAYQEGNTYNIRTRFGMVSSIIFTNDSIIQSVLGDTTGFEMQIFQQDKPNIKSLVVIKPKVIGVDTNLFLVGESGKVYNFYLFSTDYKSSLNPNLQVFVTSKIQQNTATKTSKISKDSDFLIITNKINTIKIPKNKIKTIKYTQKGDNRLKAIEIFQDNKRTYFKYKADDGKYTFPVIYAVVNGYDSRVSTQVVGDYIIADKISKAWTLRNGQSYVCVRFEDE